MQNNSPTMSHQPSKSNEDLLKELQGYLSDWAITEPEVSLILGNVRRMLSQAKDAEREKTVEEERERIKEQVMKNPLFDGCMGCSCDAVEVFKEALTPKISMDDWNEDMERNIELNTSISEENTHKEVSDN